MGKKWENIKPLNCKCGSDNLSMILYEKSFTIKCIDCGNFSSWTNDINTAIEEWNKKQKD